ncbi:MAG TPA: PD-(D/E)XK nuclease family protein [Candidatus Kryptonia bacterium]
MPIVLSKNFDGPVVEDFTSQVKTRARRGDGKYDFVYIVPTRRRVRELERELVQDVAFGRFPVYTLELFAQKVFSAMNTGKRVISTSLQGMVIDRVISRTDLKFFKFASSRPGTRRGVAPAGTIKKIVDQIGYLKENGITPEDYKLLLSVAEKPERLKLEEFLKIYAGYEKELGNNLIDTPGLLSVVNGRLTEATIRVICPEGAAFFIEGFYNFKKPELEFLKMLSRQKDFSFLVRLDCNDRNENLFKTMLATVSELKVRGFKVHEARVRDGSGKSPGSREFLGTYLFADGRPRKKLNLVDKAFIVGVRDNLREVEFVAEKIKEIVKSKPDQKLDRICVASYLPQSYSGLFREVFPKYQIPVNITDRYTLESNPIVNAVLSFIDVKLGDYERVSLLRAVTNRLVTVSDAYGDVGSIILNAAAICRFERGLKTFKSAIAVKAAVLEDAARSKTDDSLAEKLHDIEILKNAAEILDSIENTLKPVLRDMTAAGFKSAVGELVKNLRIHENIAAMDVGGILTEIVERDARALSAFLEVVEEVSEGNADAGPLPLETWVQNLRAALGLTRFNIRQRYGFGVYVTALEEMRGLEFDHVFIVGLNEGELPTRYVPEIFLPLMTQRENRETQPYLQRHLFFQAVASFGKSLHLIYPMQRDEVRLIRSSFIDAFLDAADATVLVEPAGTKETTNIYSIHQLIEADAAGLVDDKTSGAMLPINLERCKLAERARYRDDRESEFNGRITDQALVKLADGQFAGRVFSAAQIESLSRCGFQFFVRRVLHITEPPEIETSLSAIERGTVLHRILQRFYTELGRGGKLEQAKDELNLLLAIGRQVLDELGIHHELFEVERDAILGNAGNQGTLELFLKKVQARLTEYGLIPGLFEFEFGSGDLEPVSIGGVAVRGKIDRVDTGDDGPIIIDYKTSSRIASYREVVREKISPQLLIYLAALGRIAGKEPLISAPSGAAFVSLNRNTLLHDEDGNGAINFIVREKDGELKYNRSYDLSRPTRGTENYPKTMDALSHETEMFVSAKVGSARSGRFNLTEFPFEKVCLYCPYTEACRIALIEKEFEKESA